jgi:exopolysaccharide biosynthesis operon protein EpsL
MFAVGGSMTWDTNVFRLPGSADAQSRLGTAERSDRITSYYAGVRLDQPYGQQRFLLDLTGTAYRYARFRHLDFEGLNYRGAWNFHLTPRLGGTLSADRSESLVNYADFRNAGQRNVRTAEARAASVDLLLFGGWHAVGGLSQRESKTETPVSDEGSFRSDGADAGLRYVAGAGRSIGLFLRTFDGRYLDRALDPVNFLGDGFRRTELELAGTLALTGRSSFTGRLAHIRYEEQPFSERDFSGEEARLGWSWTPAGRLSLNADAARTLTPWRDPSATYKADQRMSVGASWQLAARTALTASSSWGQSRFYQPIVAQPESRRDQDRSLQVGMNWRLLRNATVTASVQRVYRDSTVEGFDYRGSIASVGASILF